MNKYYSEDYQITKNSPELMEGVAGSGGGGSCFPAGTLVRTVLGFKPIEKLRVNDKILAYDRYGEIEFGYVVDTNTHKQGEYEESLYFLYSDDICIFPKGVTGNHAVYDITTGEHKEIKDFNLGDSLLTIDNNPVSITKIDIISEPKVDVHNLIIVPQHTYCVGVSGMCIRVHNGGGGKSSSGAPRRAQEAENTLQSSAIARILEVVSHGEIEGVIGGQKGVFLNSTPLQNPDDSFNYEGATFEERVGLPSQTVIEGFSETESEVAISPTVVTTAGVVQTLPSSNVDSARVTIGFPGGLSLANTNNGDLNGYSVAYTIAVKDVAASTFSVQVSKTVTGKTTSAWEVAHRIRAPLGSTQWEIKVTRTSAEDSGSHQSSAITFARLTEIIEESETYDNIGIVGVTIPAEAAGNRIPTRSYNVKGIKCQIPDSYDPVTRDYGANYWEGGFKTAWTDNTAWVLYDLITNPEYGMENFLNQPINMDIWAFFEASLYNDCTVWDGNNFTQTLIPDGNGGTEIRYTFNAVIQTQQDAWQLIQAVASNMRAIVVMKGDEISLIQDRPKLPKKIINNSNVIDGMFVYSGAEVSNRASSVNVTFNDIEDRYLPRTVSEEDTVAIAKYGYSVKDLVAFGSVTESQSRRMAKWALDTEINQFGFTNFSMALNIITLEIGDVISLMDDEYISDTNTYLTGRTVSVTSGLIVVLDVPVTLDAGHTYTFGVMSIDYTVIEESTITTPAGTTDTLTLSSAIPDGDYVNHEFFCYSSGHIEPRQFLIQSITESDKGIYALFCLFYDPDKYDRVEQGLVAVPPVFSQLIATVLPPVTNITFSEVYMNTGISAENHINVIWDWDTANPTPDQVVYTLRWRRDNNPYIYAHDLITRDYAIPSIIPGVYEVIIEVENIQGKRSLSTAATYNYRTVAGASTLDPPENFFVLDTAGTDFVDNHIPLVWTFPTSNQTKTDTLLDYQLEVWTTDGITLLSTHIIQPDVNKNGSFDYSIDLNINDYTTPSRATQFKLYSRDGVGDLSLPVVKTFNNAVPAAPSFTVIAGVQSTFVDITLPVETDLVGVIIYRSETSGFTPQASDIIYDGPDTYVSLTGDPGVTYYFRIGVYDTFGKTGLTLASEQSTTAIDGNVDTWIFDGLVFEPNDPVANDISWTAGSASKNGLTPTAIGSGSASYVSGNLYIYYPGTGAVLATTNDLTVAVTGVLILATYKGGTDVTVGNGKAFVDGGLLLANTVGANQLVTSSAIITNTAQIQNLIVQEQHVGNGAVTNLKIGDTIQSANFSDINKLGWKIDKNGDLTSYESITLKDSAGMVIFSGNEIDGTYMKAASILNAAIGVAAVDTLELAGQAVTIPVSAFTSGVINLGTGYTEIQSAAIVSTGAPIAINASAFAGTAIGGVNASVGYVDWIWSLAIRLYRDTTVLVTYTDLTESLAVLNFVDTPGAGSYTYYLKATWNAKHTLAYTGIVPSVTSRFLSLLETKR